MAQQGSRKPLERNMLWKVLIEETDYKDINGYATHNETTELRAAKYALRDGLPAILTASGLGFAYGWFTAGRQGLDPRTHGLRWAKEGYLISLGYWVPYLATLWLTHPSQPMLLNFPVLPPEAIPTFVGGTCLTLAAMRRKLNTPGGRRAAITTGLGVGFVLAMWELLSQRPTINKAEINKLINVRSDRTAATSSSSH